MNKRFQAHLESKGLLKEGDGVVVAVSGGVDSLVLLHLLTFSAGMDGLRLRVAHFDHGMRPESGSDALWLRGLCAAWEVPLTIGEAPKPLAGEEEAREARYAFLAREREAGGERWIVTAHHADDQAETVLFRALRGTGLGGLAGIPERRAPGIFRPLLPFRRREIEAYAHEVGLSPRQDPSNLDPGYSRNFLRHEILPRLAEHFGPRVGPSLVRLARLARADEAGWRSLLPRLVDDVTLEVGESGIVVAREALLEYHPAVRGRILRELARRVGSGLDEAGTRLALEFTNSGASGRALELPRGATLTREFERLVFSRPGPDSEGSPLFLPEPVDGQGSVLVGGSAYRVEWSCGGEPRGHWREAFDTGDLCFPLELRGWVPGDRMRLSYGSKKLKKLFVEARVPEGERARIPVLVDASGRVLWVVGLERSVEARPVENGETLSLAVSHEHGE